MGYYTETFNGFVPLIQIKSEFLLKIQHSLKVQVFTQIKFCAQGNLFSLVLIFAHPGEVSISRERIFTHVRICFEIYSILHFCKDKLR